jgi:integrase
MAQKRGNGEGSIYRRKDGRWVGQYLVYTDKGPKYRYLYGKTRQAVAEKLTKTMADRDGGLVFDAGTVTLAEYLERWLNDSVRDTVRQRTFERYESIVRIHLASTLGRIKLKSLTPAHVRGLYRSKLDSGLAPRTVQYIHTTLHKALKQAVNDGLIPRNATEAVKAPRPTKKEVQTLSPSDARAFLETARGDRREALYVLALTSGMREGELLGLKWEDVNLPVGTLSVRRTLSIPQNGYIFEPPKNQKGRNIKLTAPAMEALKRHRAAQNEERLRLGGLWEDQALVFPNQTGKPMHPWVLMSSFKKILKKAGLPENTRLHDLRHTTATLLLGKGTHPKIVQEILGHATVSITLDTYSHVLPTMQDQAVANMESALF